MPSIVSVNALTAWLRRANDELKREHIHLEIGGDYYLDDMCIVILSQGVVTTPLNSLEHQGPSLPDMLSQNNTGFLPAVDYSPGAGDKLTRRSYTGIIIKINNAVVFTFSKRQTTVEAATFGPELIASRIAKEKVQALLYKLRMMGVPVISPSIMVVDNESVVKSVSVPESRLKKKHLSICYHSVREAVAGGIIAVKWVKSENNLADICTKIMSGVTFKRLLSWILIPRRLRQVRKE